MQRQKGFSLEPYPTLYEGIKKNYMNQFQFDIIKTYMQIHTEIDSLGL
jgi:hypothetical protein